MLGRRTRRKLKLYWQIKVKRRIIFKIRVFKNKVKNFHHWIVESPIFKFFQFACVLLKKIFKEISQYLDNNVFHKFRKLTKEEQEYFDNMCQIFVNSLGGAENIEKISAGCNWIKIKILLEFLVNWDKLREFAHAELIYKKPFVKIVFGSYSKHAFSKLDQYISKYLEDKKLQLEKKHQSHSSRYAK